MPTMEDTATETPPIRHNDAPGSDEILDWQFQSCSTLKEVIIRSNDLYAANSFMGKRTKIESRIEEDEEGKEKEIEVWSEYQWTTYEECISRSTEIARGMI